MKTLLYVVVALLLGSRGATPFKNPYAWRIKAIQGARCQQTKSVSLPRPESDTLVITALQMYYSPRFQYPYAWLYTPGSQDRLVLRKQGFTDAQVFKLPIPDSGSYYLLINDVNASMLTFETANRDSITGILRIGCALHEE